jgi:hypothetical protein
MRLEFRLNQTTSFSQQNYATRFPRQRYVTYSLLTLCVEIYYTDLVRVILCAQRRQWNT